MEQQRTRIVDSNEPLPINWHYIAGIFDGEGHIDASNHGIGITNTHLNCLKLIQNFLARNGISSSINEKGDGRTNPCYTLFFNKRTCVKIFLNNVIPILIVKNDDKTRKLYWWASHRKEIAEIQYKNISIANTGHITPEEVKKKISKANTGRIVTTETRKKISDGRKKYLATKRASNN